MDRQEGKREIWNDERALMVVCGPTASGKSAVAVALCEMLDGEVVSCDSMQIYRGMDIGTATPTAAEMGGIPHHMINVVEPTEVFSAAAYREMALPIIYDIRARGKVPILCGGTGLYINALTRPMHFAEKGDEAVRTQLMATALGSPGGKRELHDRLRSIDPASAARLHENDVRRVVRALEVFQVTGLTLSEQAALDQARDGDFRGILFAPDWPRETLYERIDRRVDGMLEEGLLDEVRALLRQGVPDKTTAMQAIGYKELVPVALGQARIEDAAAQIKQNSRRYAKRQLTWFRGDARTRWIGAEGRSARDISREIVERLEADEHSDPQHQR